MSQPTNPKDAYAIALADLEKKVADLQVAIAQHAKKTNGAPNWSHYGDLRTVESALNTYLNFLGQT